MNRRELQGSMKPYSEKPSAVRMRRKRLNDARRRKLEQLVMIAGVKAPKVITWHCGCGAAVPVYDEGTVQIDAWIEHRRSCLFTRAAFPIVVERAPGTRSGT